MVSGTQYLLDWTSLPVHQSKAPLGMDIIPRLLFLERDPGPGTEKEFLEQALISMTPEYY